MIAVIVALQFAGLTYSPAFVFPGEALKIAPLKREQRTSLHFHSAEGARVRETRDGWILTANQAAPAFATFLFDPEGDGMPEDGTVIEAPVALCPARSLFLPAPGVYDGAAVTAFGGTRVAVIPTTVGSALVMERGGKQVRLAPMLEAEVAVRTAARRARFFAASYSFAGPSGITLLGRPGGIAAVSIRIEADGVHARYVALFHQSGTLRLLGAEREVTLAPTEEVGLFVPFAALDVRQD